MKRLYAMAIGVFMSVFLISAVNAAPAGTSQPKQQQGIKNAKKAMQSRLDRYKKMREGQKKGQAKRREAQSGK